MADDDMQQGKDLPEEEEGETRGGEEAGDIPATSEEDVG